MPKYRARRAFRRAEKWKEKTQRPHLCFALLCIISRTLSASLSGAQVENMICLQYAMPWQFSDPFLISIF